MERPVKGVPGPNLDKINPDMKDSEQIQGITNLLVSKQCSTISCNTNQGFSSEMCTFAPVLYSISPKPRETDRPAKPVPCQGPKATNYKVLYDCMTHHRANVDRLRLTSVIFRNLPICIQLLLNSRSATRMQPLQTHLSKALEVFSCPYMSQQFSSRSTRAFYHVLSMENMENQNLRSFKKIKDNERQRKHHVVHLYLFRCFPIFCCAQLWNSIGFYPAWPFCWAAQFAKFHWPGPRPGDRSTAQQMCKSEPTWFYMSALPKRDWDIPLYIGTFKARPATESWYTIQNGNFLAEAVAACHTAAKSFRKHVETKTIEL